MEIVDRLGQSNDMLQNLLERSGDNLNRIETNLAARASESVASAAGAAGIPCAPSASGPARLKRVARANALFMSFSCPRVNRLQQPACHMICV